MHIKIVRVYRWVHKDPTELHELALFQRTSHLSRLAHNRAELWCCLYHEHIKVGTREKKHLLTLTTAPHNKNCLFINRLWLQGISPSLSLCLMS